MSNRDAVLGQQIQLALTGQNRPVPPEMELARMGGVPLPVIPMKPAHRNVRVIVGLYTSAATPASKQVYTVTPGKVLNVIAIWVTSGGATGNLTLRDAIADGGVITLTQAITNSSPVNLPLLENYPLQYENGIRFDAADQLASTNYRFFIVGWEEDRTSTPRTVYVSV